MSLPAVRLLADSLSPTGEHRLSTLELVYHRFIHPEFLTHRQLSRNAASSRAIPTDRLMALVDSTPARPLYWGRNRAGMQATEELEAALAAQAEAAWLEGAQQAILQVRQLLRLGVHKQVANRLLEPYLPIRVVASATDWGHFLALRDHPDAQPEIQALARLIRAALQTSTPERLAMGAWHLPYVSAVERRTHGVEIARAMSVARCARVSYRLHDGGPTTPAADQMLCDRLLHAEPPHASPFEHIATPDPDPAHWANFQGWRQWRRELPNEALSLPL